jgi:hypothetical protein
MRFRLSLLGLAAVLLLTLTGTALAAPRPVPAPPAPGSAIVDVSSRGLAGDRAALDQAMAESSAIHPRILVVDDTGDGRSLTDYLELVADQWGEPRHNSLLLVVFTGRNNNIRFWMGADMIRAGITVDEMLDWLHMIYFDRTHLGDPAGGLARLIRRVNLRMAGAIAEPLSQAEALAAFVNPLEHGDVAALEQMTAPEGLVIDRYRMVGAPFTGVIGRALDRSLTALLEGATPQVEAYSLETDRRVDVVVRGLNPVAVPTESGPPVVAAGRVKLSLRQEPGGVWRFWLLSIDDLGLLEQEMQSSGYHAGPPGP